MFIHVDYRLEPGEFAKVASIASRRSFWASLACVVIAAMLLALMYGGPLLNPAVSPPSFAISGPVAAVGVYYLVQLCLRRPLLERRFRAWKVDRVVASFTESGVSWRTWTQNGEYTSEVTWSEYVRIRETSELFLLHSSKKTVMGVPKRAFDAQDVELFSRFVREGFPQARSAARAEFVPKG